MSITTSEWSSRMTLCFWLTVKGMIAMPMRDTRLYKGPE
jgi:hypothetical protein